MFPANPQSTLTSTPPEELVAVESPDISHLETEDETPLDNFIQEKQQRLLTQCLYSSLKLEIPFLAAANVGLFYAIKQAPLVPDAMLSLGVAMPQDWSQKKNRSYFVWELGKPPEVAIEVVSNKKGQELGSKLSNYARAGVAYYTVFDPLQQLQESTLQVYGLREGQYTPLETSWMERVSLGLTLWQGEFEGVNYSWLRWCDQQGNLLLTGDERSQEIERQLEQERLRAEQEHRRAERLAALLREQGINPDELP